MVPSSLSGPGNPGSHRWSWLDAYAATIRAQDGDVRDSVTLLLDILLPLRHPCPHGSLSRFGRDYFVVRLGRNGVSSGVAPRPETGSEDAG